MARIPFHQMAQCDIAVLPDSRVQTIDGRQVEPGMKLYHKFTPETISEYEVLLDVAFKDPHTKEWQVILLGPRLPVMSRPVNFFVADLSEWKNFYAGRHEGEKPEIIEGSKRKRRRKRKPERKLDAHGRNNSGRTRRRTRGVA